MRTALLRCLVLSTCFGTGAVLAQSAPNPLDSEARYGENSIMRAMFSNLDTNKDGKVSFDEAKTMDFLAKNFRRFDRNGDGFLSYEEFVLAYPDIPK